VERDALVHITPRAGSRREERYAQRSTYQDQNENRQHQVAGTILPLSEGGPDHQHERR
jgi:hypothetical protein